jgi:ribonuclease PH
MSFIRVLENVDVGSQKCAINDSWIAINDFVIAITESLIAAS